MSTLVVSSVPAPVSSATSVSRGHVASKDKTVVAQAVTGAKDPAPVTEKSTDAKIVVAPSGSSAKPEQESCDDNRQKSASDQQGENDENCAAVIVAQDNTNPLWVLAGLPILGLGGGSDTQHNAVNISSTQLNGDVINADVDDIHLNLTPEKFRFFTMFKHGAHEDIGEHPGELHIIRPDGKYVDISGSVKTVLFEDQAGFLDFYNFDKDGQHFNFVTNAGDVDGTTGNDLIVGTTSADDPSSAPMLDGGAGDDILFALPSGSILIGGKGQDLMFGGVGNDTFEFNAGDFDGNRDIVVNFDAENDVIDLSGLDLDSAGLIGTISEDGDRMVISFEDQAVIEVYFVAEVMVNFQVLLNEGVIIV